jgi:hypothetical protein
MGRGELGKIGAGECELGHRFRAQLGLAAIDRSGTGCDSDQNVPRVSLLLFKEITTVLLEIGLERGVLGRKQASQTGSFHHQVTEHTPLCAPVLLGASLEVIPQIGFRHLDFGEMGFVAELNSVEIGDLALAAETLLDLVIADIDALTQDRVQLGKQDVLRVPALELLGRHSEVRSNGPLIAVGADESTTLTLEERIGQDSFPELLFRDNEAGVAGLGELQLSHDEVRDRLLRHVDLLLDLGPLITELTRISLVHPPQFFEKLLL